MHFPLDENGDASFTDLAANENSEASVSSIAAAGHGALSFGDGVIGKSFIAAGSQWFEYGDRLGSEKDQAFSVAAYVFVTPQGGSPFGKMDDANGARGWSVEFHGLRPSVHLIHRWPGDAIHVQAKDELPANTFTHLAFTYDGSGKAAGLKLYINGLLAKTSVKQDGLVGSIKTTTPFSIGRRAQPVFQGRIDDLRVYQRELTAVELATVNVVEIIKLVAVSAEHRTAQQKEQIEKFFRQTEVPELAKLQISVAELCKAKVAFENALPIATVMSQMPKPRDTFIECVETTIWMARKLVLGFPLLEITARAGDKTLNRLDLATWLTSPDSR